MKKRLKFLQNFIENCEKVFFRLEGPLNLHHKSLSEIPQLVASDVQMKAAALMQIISFGTNLK